MKILKYFLISMVLLLPRLGAADAELLAVAADNHVKLMWLSDEWDSNQTGFNLKKRVPNGQWQTLNTSLLTPELSSTKDYSVYGLNAEQTTALQEKYTILVNSGRINPMTNAEMLSVLQGENDLRPGFVSFKGDFDLALFASMGYIDNDFADGDEYEYGLFPVDDSGTEEALLSSVAVKYYPVDDASYQVNMSYKRTNSITLQWSYPANEFNNRALKGFIVYRKEADGTFKEISGGSLFYNDPGVAAGDPEPTDFYWTFEDVEADPALTQVYAIMPSNCFQSDFPEYFTYTYDPAANKSLSNDPVLSPLQNKGPGEIVINWALADEAEANLVKHFNLTVTNTTTDETITLAENLDKADRSFTDTTSKVESQIYTYNLTAVDRNDQEFVAVKNLFYVKVLIPPAITGLAATVSKVDDDLKVSLTWDEKAADDTTTDFYRLFHDFSFESEMIEQGTLGNITGNSYDLIWGTSVGRETTIGLVPVSTTSDRGEMATIKVFMPNLSIDFPPVFTVEKIDNNNLKFTWEFDESTALDLKGFRLYLKGQVVLDETTLTKELRTHTMTLADQAEDTSYQYSITAVSSIAESMQKMAPSVTLNKPITGYQPEDFTVTRNGNQVVLSWKEVDLDANDLAGFKVLGDSVIENRFYNLPRALYKKFSYTWDLPQNPRDTYHFKIAPVKKNSELGPAAEATLDLTQ